MKSITFTCETITPMFLSGADGSTPELRPPSIKGALRFWWRAMNGHLVEKKKDKNGKENWDYSKLREEESKIFGGADEKSGRSKILIRFTNKSFINQPFSSLKSKKKTTGKQSMDSLKYIGFGLFKTKNTSEKSFLKGKWEMIITYNPIIEKELKTALSALNLFGCLGSKARNGFGSISIKMKETGKFILLDEKELQEELKNDNLRNFSAFKTPERFTKYVLASELSSPLEALEEIAVKYFEAKANTKPNKYVASDKLNGLGDRYPKRYAFSVKQDANGYYAQVIYLPMQLSGTHKEDYLKQNQRFQENLKAL